jgi:hypothetical protein
VSDARHSPPGDDSFRASLLRNGLGAIGLVVLVAAAFWAIGTLGGAEVTPTASDSPEPEVAAPADDDAETDTGEEPATDGDEPTEEPETGDAAGAGDEADTDVDGVEPAEPEQQPEDEPAEPEQPEEPEEPAEPEEPGEPAEPAVPPGEVTVQVLDGVKADGGAAADEVAELLGDAGYDIVARNDALSYDVTTVLYNPGHEDAAAQIAAELGGAEVREQPGNLSSAVAVHVVVGADRA